MAGDRTVHAKDLTLPSAIDRLLAWLIDWLVLLAWVAVVAAVGVPLLLAGVTSQMDPIALNILAVVTLALPATVALAAMESGVREATLGKRVRGLRVVTHVTGQRLSLARALVRNVLKIGVPWTIGHASAFAIITSASSPSMPGPVVALTSMAYALPLLYVACLFVGARRTPYDRVSGSRVERARATETDAIREA